MRLIKTKKSFRVELKRQLRYAIAAAVGFMIIYAWRDAILEGTKSLVEKISSTTHVVTTEVSTALFISIMGVLIILVTSKLLKD
jgi:ABC-type polysaccharide/polyol phosphate export permease